MLWFSIYSGSCFTIYLVVYQFFAFGLQNSIYHMKSVNLKRLFPVTVMGRALVLLLQLTLPCLQLPLK